MRQAIDSYNLHSVLFWNYTWITWRPIFLEMRKKKLSDAAYYYAYIFMPAATKEVGWSIFSIFWLTWSIFIRTLESQKIKWCSSLNVSQAYVSNFKIVMLWSWIVLELGFARVILCFVCCFTNIGTWLRAFCIQKDQETCCPFFSTFLFTIFCRRPP